MKIFFLTAIYLLIGVLDSKSQNTDSRSFLTFISYQNMVVYFDSSGKLEMTMGWEKSTDNVTIDVYGNRIMIKNAADGKEKLFVLGVRGKKYKSSGTMDIIPFYQCTDNKEKRCGIRLMLQETEDVSKHPSYLYIDYAGITQVYQLFWNSTNNEGVEKKENTNNEPIANQSKQGCLFISDSFDNISSAFYEIDNTTFTFHDIYYPESTKINKTLFYACEKKDGHLLNSLMIVRTSEKDYILQNVPKSVWSDFRKAKSSDLFFENNLIKNYKNILK